jgi:DNA-binding NtrC family response regulator
MNLVMQESVKVRSVVLASANAGLRQRLKVSLSDMRWQVREAMGGAEAMAHMEEHRPEALVVDNWLPDLEVGEFVGQMHQLYPGVDLLHFDGGSVAGCHKSPRRHELLHALREAQETGVLGARDVAAEAHHGVIPLVVRHAAKSPAGVDFELREMVGRTAGMLELGRLIRLVAPTSATVLIEGETGTGKEVVAKAVHRLSMRSAKPFCVLNCAAIPETLLEAELFGHTRGAFTGAVQSRMGRIEAAHGGTLFLDEIGEMPLALQAKMLRFLECGELQRVGDNDTMHVDVRVIAATHKDLEKGSVEGTFRLDLYHRLAVFPLEVPPLRERKEDLPLLVEFLMTDMGRDAPSKRLTAEALAKLQEHEWPGNVRELCHVLQRGCILAGDAAEIGAEEIRYRKATRDAAGYVRPGS